MKYLNSFDIRKIGARFLGAIAIIGLAGVVTAAPPVVKTTRFVSSLPGLAHDTYSGKVITLKGTCDQQGATLHWIWDFGDGSAVATGTVSDKYVIQATHAYTGPVNVTYTARLTVTNTATGEVGSGTYSVIMRDKTLQVEANISIEEGLWYLHKEQHRSNSGGVDYGDWTSAGSYGGYAYDSYVSISALNMQAFEVSGFLESGDPGDPYTETVQRGMRSLLSWLTPISIGTQVNGLCTLNPDSNTNGIGIMAPSQSGDMRPYQSGMFMDAIIASSTPDAFAAVGVANVVGRKYRDIIQDMVDAYVWAQYDGSPGGGWRYAPNQAPDNSACQWAAIGMIPAERNWGSIIPQCVKDWNIVWLKNSQNTATGVFGYADTTPAAGPYATTPSGLVQLAMDGVGRDAVLPGETISRWNLSETFICDNFRTPTGGAASNIKDYYYGLFSFTKAMHYHVANGVPTPITLLQSKTPGVLPIDWYWDPTYGVVRKLVDNQSSGGYWYGHDYYSQQYAMETGMAVIMLTKTVVEQLPVAVIVATPNPALTNAPVRLDGTGSYHQSPTNVIVQWDWDLNNDGTYETPGPIVTTSWPTPGTNRVWLRVTDDLGKQAVAYVDIVVVPPPVPPTANAGAHYVFCSEQKPWYLDGSRSVNPDDGICVPCPGSTNCTPDAIVEYAWDLDGTLRYTNAFGPLVDVTAFFEAKGPGSNYTVNLRVKDRTTLSYPCSGSNDLTGFASATVEVQATCSTNCSTLTVTRTGPCAVLLTWTAQPSASAYRIYRGTTKGGPYSLIASVPASVTSYPDTNVVCTATNYYVVRPSARNSEFCQSDEQKFIPNVPPVCKAKGMLIVGTDVGACTAVVPPEMIDDGSYDPDGDPITLTVKPLGPYPIGTNIVTLTVCDNKGACSGTNCQTLIVVQDRTPPTVVCPAPITVEFQDENGAVVPCVVTASDLCSPVSLTVTPPCGSLFPIGTTPVQALAVDAAGNSNACAFTVTVLGAQGVKSNVLVELIILRDQATQQQNGNDVGWWNCAIQDLITSLEPNRWLDQTHVVCGKPGYEVFDLERQSVICLTNLIDWGGSGIPGPTLQDLVDRLVRADRLLAVVAIQNAVLAGTSPVVISNALVNLARGDEAAIGGQASGPDFGRAIYYYRLAWAWTCHVCAPVVTPQSGGKAKIQFSGVPGVKYVLQATTDMVTWKTLTTVTMGSSGTSTYTDTHAGQYPNRFYRVVPTQ